MARFILNTGSVPGHINPTLPICSKLIQAGHEVVWITGRVNKEKVKKTGAIFHPLPEMLDRGEKGLYEFHPELAKLKGIKQIKWYLKHMFLDSAPHIIKTIDTIMKSFKADVLIGDTISFGLFFKAELSGLPSAMISLLPLSLTSIDTAPFGMGLPPGNTLFSSIRNRILYYFTNHILFRDIDQHADKVRKELGLSPLDKPFLRYLFEIPSVVMHISTPIFEYPRSDSINTLRFIGPILNEKEVTFSPPPWWNILNDGKRVILINQGTVATDLKDLITPAIDGLKDEDYTIIAIPLEEGGLKDLPPNVKTSCYVPFSNLLPHVDVMVTNGGYGGTQLALAHGIPLLVAGQTDDKMEVAARVEWSGAGINLKKQKVTPLEIKKGVQKILSNPSYKKNAERIQADFKKYDAPENARTILEGLKES